MPNPHITVPDQDPIFEQEVTSSTDTFAFSFTFFDADDLVVTVNDEKLLSSEYEVTGEPGFEGGYAGGSVVLDVAVENSNVKIYRDIIPTRTGDFLEGGGFRATPVNTEIDRLVARQQDMRRRFQRIPTFSSSVNKTLEATDMGTQWTNNAASGAIELTLPTASAGLHAWFSVVNALSLTIIAADGDEILDDGSTGTEMLSSTIGSIVHLIVTDIGTWVVDSKNGTWALS